MSHTHVRDAGISPYRGSIPLRFTRGQRPLINIAKLFDFRTDSAQALSYPPQTSLRSFVRDAGIEPAFSVWKTDVLPLNESRLVSTLHERFTPANAMLEYCALPPYIPSK